ncbi:MAG: type II toxin-antitoxin system RelE/ParE family toxin [Candidatus Acidiferrum sp.]
MEVRWSPEAADDLERIGRRIQQDKPNAARNVVLTLYHGIADLRTFPNRGRSGRIEGTRELVFPSLPYIAVYRVHHQAVEIVRIYHAAQNWP